MWLPLRRKDQHAVERLVVFDSFDDLTAYQPKFSELADTVQQMFTQVATLRDTPLHPPAKRQLITSTYIQGFSIHSSGLTVRPRLPGQQICLPILSEYLKRFKGPGWTATPNLELRTDKQQTACIRREVTGGWVDRCRRSQQSAARLRSYLRLALRPLAFHH